MTEPLTDLQAALRKACEDAAKDIIRDAQCSVNLTCPSENSLISRMLQYVPPVVEALRDSVIEECAQAAEDDNEAHRSPYIAERIRALKGAK